MVKILIVDDDIDLCKLISKRLKKEGYIVITLHNGEEVMECLKATYYDLIILDVMLPGVDGFSLLQKIRMSSYLPVIMLTAKDEENDKVYGLRIGADDYLTKPFSINELVERINSILRRCNIFNSNSEKVLKEITFDGIIITPQKRKVVIDEIELMDLTPKEFDILYFLSNHNEQVFTKQQIYEQVWGDVYTFDDNNITAHIKRLRAKLGIHQNCIQTVWGVGYKFCGRCK